MMPGAGGDLNMTLPMVLNIVGFFLCCGLASILFLVGFIFTMQGNTMKSQGDIMGATAKRKSAMTMAFIGYGLGVVGYIIYILMQAMR